MYTGPWIKMPKTRESSERPEGMPLTTLMHDDAAARALGFRGGFVGGPHLEGVMAAAIPASFGHLWYESGAHNFRVFNPVYNGEEVRVGWEESTPDPGDKRKITYWLEKKNGERAAAGWAALGDPGVKLTPPWERKPSRGVEPASDILPHQPLGSKMPPRDMCYAKEELTRGFRISESIQDSNWWYRIASPYGKPLLSPYSFGGLVLRYQTMTGRLHGENDDTPPLWMYAGVDLVVYHPVFADDTYRMESQVVEKGSSARSQFFVEECSIDDKNGVRVARVRMTQRLLQVAKDQVKSLPGLPKS